MWRSVTLLLLVIPAILSGLAIGANEDSVKQNWRLSEYCPPGFVLDPDQTCRLQSMYESYSSIQDAGVGGLRTGLPAMRDGFTPQQIDLGRLLFFDPLLSADGTVACASCHNPDMGLSDGRARSVGINHAATTRSAPSLWNMGLHRRFFWDGRASSLEEQMQGPLYSDHEMGNTPEQLLTALQATPAYVALFGQAFGVSPISLDQVYQAITAFETSLVSLNSRYDLYAHGFHDVLTEKEIEGMNVFRSFVARCAECHTPPLFSNQQIAVLGTPEPEGQPLDIGAEGVSGDPSQRGGFKVPSLRNIALTAPYMHTGRYATLREAIAFYNEGRGHAVPEGETLDLHWHIWEPQLSNYELDRLVDFLHTLTDENFKPRVPEELPSGLLPANSLVDSAQESHR